MQSWYASFAPKSLIDHAPLNAVSSNLCLNLRNAPSYADHSPYMYLTSGHTFCIPCCMRWLTNKTECPECRHKVVAFVRDETLAKLAFTVNDFAERMEDLYEGESHPAPSDPPPVRSPHFPDQLRVIAAPLPSRARQPQQQPQQQRQPASQPTTQSVGQPQSAQVAAASVRTTCATSGQQVTSSSTAMMQQVALPSGFVRPSLSLQQHTQAQNYLNAINALQAAQQRQAAQSNMLASASATQSSVRNYPDFVLAALQARPPQVPVASSSTATAPATATGTAPATGAIGADRVRIAASEEFQARLRRQIGLN